MSFNSKLFACEQEAQIVASPESLASYGILNMAKNNDRFCVDGLKKERKNCNFDQEELTNLLDGGKDLTAFRRRIAHKFLNDPIYDDEIPSDYLSHEDRSANELRKSCHTFQVLRRENYSLRDFLEYGPGGLMKYGNPIGVSFSVFVEAIRGQGNTEQKEKWLGRAERAELIGSYVQTELGHGTFLRGLETTATYDPKTQEFVLHTPTITATKWWPGSLGKIANYAVVMAQLYTKGKCYGPHPFFVQIRNEVTHRSLPGVTIGEIGPIMGSGAYDNGFLVFEHFRIPRTNMLMKYSQVLEDGTYMKPAHAKLAYVTLLTSRNNFLSITCKQLQRAVTIATRYSAVRQQSELVPGEPEPQILEYQTQQYKVIPHIATVFAILFAARSSAELFTTFAAKMEEGVMDMLPELHVLSSGLKALSSTDASEGVDICRLACGGHGYLSSSNLPRIFVETTTLLTVEGENTVLWLQVARYLIKSYLAFLKGDKLRGSVAYLGTQPTSTRAADLSDKGLVEAYKTAALNLIYNVNKRLQRLVESGLNYHHAWNKCSVDLVKSAQAHIRYYMCEQFVKNVDSLDASDGVKHLLRTLRRLYLVYHITRNEGDFLKSGALSANDLIVLGEELGDLLAALRPQAVSIVDSFDIDDKLLNSTIGAWDGDVYQRLYDEAQKSPLNKEDVLKSYNRYLQPLMQSATQAEQYAIQAKL